MPSWLAANTDLRRQAQLQAAALAVRALDIVVPPIGEVSEEDILETRYRLREQLIPFRRGMLALVPVVRSGIESAASLNEVYEEAGYVVETTVIPALNELRDRLEREKGKFWRRLLFRGALAAPRIVLNLATQSPLVAALSALSDTAGVGREVAERHNLLLAAQKQGVFGYLPALPQDRLFNRQV